MLLKGELCCCCCCGCDIDDRSEGIRNVGGALCAQAGFKSLLMAGRMEVDVDMREWENGQWPSAWI